MTGVALEHLVERQKILKNGGRLYELPHYVILKLLLLYFLKSTLKFPMQNEHCRLIFQY